MHNRLARDMLLLLSDTGKGIKLPSTNLLYLYDPSVGVYADTALTSPISDGGATKGFSDRSSNGYHLTQAGASTLDPTYRASVAAFNGKPALEFDGGDYLARTGLSPICANLNVYTIYIVFQSTSASSSLYLMSEGSSSSNTPRVATEWNAGQVRYYHVGDGGAFSAPGLAGTNYNDGLSRLMTCRRIAADDFQERMNYWRDHGTDGVTAPGTTTTDQLCIGGLLRTTFGNGFVGQIALMAAYAEDNYLTIEPLILNYFGISGYYPGTKHFVGIGDSKTYGSNDGLRDYVGGFGFPYVLAANLTTATGDKWRELTPRPALGGLNTHVIKTSIDGWLAAISGTPAPEAVLINVGANDVPSMPTQASYETDLGYIIDACHTKWPLATMYVMDIWRRTYAAECATLAGYNANVIAAGRTGYAAAGPDEAVFLENGDDGATYTADGIHPNHAGYALTAAQWQTIMGY